MREKLRRSRGETLTETLVAILVVSLTSVTLAAMIGGGVRINATAQARDEQLLSAVTAAENHAGPGLPGQVEVTVGSASRNLDVTYYTDNYADGDTDGAADQAGTLYAYGREAGDAP